MPNTAVLILPGGTASSGLGAERYLSERNLDDAIY